MIDYRDLETRHNWYRKAGDGYAQNVCKLLEKKILTMLTLLKRLKMLELTLCMKNKLSYLYLECLGHQELENMGMGLDGVRAGRTDRRTYHTPS